MEAVDRARDGGTVLVSASLQMAQIQSELKQAARSDAKILLSGESGVGKEVIARLVHEYSPRRMRPFVAINCAGVPDTLLESELFGHVRGSFTGAYRDKPGLLEQANGGTIFLDEVGEMTLRMQALLLRFLEDGTIHRVGCRSTNGNHRCSGCDGDESSARRSDCCRLVPRGPVLSYQRDPHRRSAAARSA